MQVVGDSVHRGRCSKLIFLFSVHVCVSFQYFECDFEIVMQCLTGLHLGLLDNSRGDDPQVEDFLIVAEFELVPRRRRGALTVGLNTLNQQGSNDNNQSVVIDLYEEDVLNISVNPYGSTNYFSFGFDQGEEEYDNAFMFSRGNHAEDSSEISDATTENSPVSHFSATAEDSDPECRPTPLKKRLKKRKLSDCQHHASYEDCGHDPTSVPVKRRRVRTKVLSETPQHCTDPLRDTSPGSSKKRSEKRNKSPSQHKHGSKNHRTDHLKKRSKGGKIGKSKKRKRSNKDNSPRRMKRQHPDRASDKRVAKGNRKRLGQQENPTPKRKRKKKRKHLKHAAKHEGRDVEQALIGTSGKRKRKDDTKSNEYQCSGTKDHLPEPPKKKKCEWIMNLFRRKTKPAPLPTDSKEDPTPPKKRNRNAK